MTTPETYSLPVQCAINSIAATVRAEWRTAYLPGDGSELRLMAMIGRVERQMRGVGSEMTIRPV